MANISEAEIRKLAEEAVKQLGGSATKASIEKVVKEAAAKMNDTKIESSPETQTFSMPRGAQNRIIVTAFGKNQTGILAGLTTVLSEHSCDIVDLSQKILQEFFTIMILVDIAESSYTFEQVKEKITQKGEQLDLKVVVQHEEIFNTMHRV